jgi:uncharacterized membrane protein YhiD involved in acid resistance
MYKLVAAAIVSVFMIVFLFLFAPGTKKIDRPKPKTDNIKKQETVVHNEENLTDLMSASINDDDKITFKKMDNPRGDAASHGMEEKYFESFDINDFNTMSYNLEERLSSISKARVKSERAKKGYESKH